MPDWFAGVGAISALAFAAWAARSAHAQLVQLREAELDHDNERKRAQASHVAAWVWLADESEQDIAISFSNTSQLPVYNVTLGIRYPGGVVFSKYSVTEPTERPVCLRRASDQLLHSVERAATSGSLEPWLIDDSGAPNWIALTDKAMLGVAVTFLDAEGRWWARDLTGKLHEAPSEQLAQHGHDMEISEVISARLA